MKKLLLILLCLPMIGFGQIFTHKVDSVIVYYQDSITLNQIRKDKQEKVYDANNNQTFEGYYYWDLSTNSWFESQKREYTYDANNNQTLYTYFTWDISANSWLNNTKIERTYDTNHNNVQSNNYYWNITSLTWDFTSSGYGNYNLAGLYSQTLGLVNSLLYVYTFDFLPVTSNIPTGFNLNLYPDWGGTSGWRDSASVHCSSVSTTSIEEENSETLYTREVVKVIDLLGRETPYKRNTPLFYIYDDGTVEKRIVIE